MSEKIYCGSGKEKIWDDGGSSINVSLNMEIIRQNWGKFGFTTDAGKQILKLKINRRKSPGNYGETHTVEIDTWKAGNNGGQGEVPF